MIEFERFFKVLERDAEGITIEYYNKKMMFLGQDVIESANVDFELDALRGMGVEEVK